jgi:hypothetical protein
MTPLASENTCGAAASIEHTGTEKRAMHWIRRRLWGMMNVAVKARLEPPPMDTLRTLMRALLRWECLQRINAVLRMRRYGPCQCALVLPTPKQQERSESRGRT